MTKDKSAAAVIGGILILVALYGLFEWTGPSSLGVAGAALAGNARMVDIATSSTYSIASGSYPQFTNVSAGFNAEIRMTVERAIEAQSMTSAENWKARYETAIPSEHIAEFPADADKFPLTVKSTVIRNDAKVISVLLTIDDYTGGAHGETIEATFNYDVAAERDITLDDLMKGDPQFLQKLSEKTRIILRDLLSHNAEVAPDQIDTEMLNDGTAPIKANFMLFTLPSDTEATFYFSEYQVAAYVFGTPEIHVPLPLQ